MADSDFPEVNAPELFAIVWQQEKQTAEFLKGLQKIAEAVAHMQSDVTRLKADLLDIKAGQQGNANKLIDIRAGQQGNASKLIDIRAGQQGNASKLIDIRAGQQGNASKLTDIKAGQRGNASKLTDIRGRLAA